MAKTTTNRLTTVSTSLVPEEAKSLTVSELCREGMQWYLANHERQAADSRETLLEKRMRKMEERMAALQARTAIDVGMIYMIMYRNMDNGERDQVVAWAYNNSVARLKKKLEGQAAEIKEQMQRHED